MRILITTAGSHGDVLPFVALASEFIKRGHEVVLYGNPFFARLVSQAGAAFRPVGTIQEHNAFFSAQSESDPVKAMAAVAREFARLTESYYAGMRADIVPGETLAIGGSLMFAHRLIAETHGGPCATVHLAPAAIRSSIRPARLAANLEWLRVKAPLPVKRLSWWAMDKAFYNPHFTAPFNALRSRLGLSPVKNVFQSWIHQADCVLGMFPDWFACPQPDWPSDLVLTGFPLYDHGIHEPQAAWISEFISAGSPPVGFSAGTATANAREFFAHSVRACERAGMRGILLSHFPEQIPAQLPPTVLHVPYAPFRALLPKLAAFVHHGGIGTTSQALRAGVPQLIRPVAYDQFDNALAATNLGVAREILPSDYNAKTAATMLGELISDTRVHERCRDIASRFAGEPVSIACDTILRRCAVSSPRSGSVEIPTSGQSALAVARSLQPGAGACLYR
jgi:UDP:flavonoid glycosyltransferase YjiC (YdhE family)